MAKIIATSKSNNIDYSVFSVNGFLIVYKKREGMDVWLPHFFIGDDVSKDDYMLDDMNSECIIRGDINEEIVQDTFNRWVKNEEVQIGLIKLLLGTDFVKRSHFGKIKF
jgi:hypothetical protein